MGVRFVIGRSGSGKTRRCFDRIVAGARAEPLGKPILWIVPKQATFQTERDLTIELGAFSRVQVFSFERLGEAVLAECGGTAVPAVSGNGRRMILGWVLRSMADELSFFGGVARQPGLATKLDATFVELERQGKSPANLKSLSDQLNGASTSLGRKISDLEKIYKAYLDFLGQDRLDPHRRLQEVLVRMADCQLLAGAEVYIDGFLDYGDYERRMTAGIAKSCENLEITVLADTEDRIFSNPHSLPDQFNLFHHTESAYRKLYFWLNRENIVIDSPILLRASERFSAPALKQLECDCGLGPKAPSSDASGAVTFVEALDRRGEALSAARRARQFVRGGGRYRDVLVLCRDINDYAEAMGAAFTEYGIPCFIDRRRTVAHHPVLQLLNAALMILIRAWPHEAIMSAIKSGLVGLSPDQADELESYCLRHRIHGEHAWTSERSWLYRRIGARDGEEDTPVNDSGAAKSADYLRRKVAKPLAKLQAAMCVDGNSNLKSQISDFRFQISNSEAGISESPPPSPVRQRSPQAGAPGEGERHVSPVAHGRGAPATVGPIAGDEQSNSKSGIQNPKSTADDQSQTGNLTIARRVAALFDFFETLNIRRTLGLWMNVAEKAGDIEQRDEHEQVWNRVTDLFDEMIDVLGEREVSLADFAEIVQSGLESFDLALTPPTIDQVLVGQIDRTRSSRTRLTILLGMNEGQFPRPATEDSILNDAERGELKRQDFDLEDDSQRRRMDEDLMAYIAMTRSSDQLLLLRSIYDEKGNPAAPGLFWLELRQRFADQPLIGAGESAAQIDTERQLLERLMGWVRGENPPDAILLNLYQWCRPRLGADNLWSRIWRALSYENKAQLSAAKAQSLFGQPLRISVSQVEQLARCPFKHFLRYGLLLEPPVEQEPTAIDLGNVYHQSLERFVSALLREKLDLASLPRGHADELIDQCAREVGATLNEELMISSARNQHLLSWIGQNLKMVAAAQQAAAQRGDFRPAATELSFGSDANDPSIEVTSPNGHLVQLRGRIDRVDLDRATGAFAVIDYKSSARNLQLFRVGHGLMLQLLVYMLILQWHGAELMGQDLKPAAGLYVELSRKKEQVKNPAEAPEPGDGKFDLRIRPRGVIQQEFIAQLDHQWQQNDAPVLSAKINKDGSIPKAGSDLFTPEELKVLLKFARRKVGELADQILQGCIDIHPYRIGTETACAGCEYKSVCRFQPAPGAYLDIPRLKREAAIEMMSEQMDYDASGDLAEPRGDGR